MGINIGSRAFTATTFMVFSLLSCWSSSALIPTAMAADAPTDTAEEPVDYMIVVTGGELLAGAYADGHTHFLTRTLRPLGLHCVGSMCVDDKREHLTDALRYAARKSSLILVTGGLGPTDNDITRETLSEYTGIPVKEHAEVLQRMARRFGTSPEKLRANLRQQTQVPIRGTYLKNSNGSAVGLVFECAEGDSPIFPAGKSQSPSYSEGDSPIFPAGKLGQSPSSLLTSPKVVVALPGPPRELQAMVHAELVPYLNRRFGTRLPGCSLRLRFVGLGQSQVDQTLENYVPLPPDVVLSSQFDGSRVDFTFALPDDTPQDRARLERLKQKILQHLGDYVYADDDTSLERSVVKLLQARGATLALAEAGSGGRLAAGFHGAEGARGVVAGAFVAPTEEKLRRLLRVPEPKWSQAGSSLQRTELLATAVAESTGSPWAIAVGEPQQAPGGGRYVEVVLKLPDGSLESRRTGLRGTGELTHARLTTQLLDQLRRRLR